MGFCNGARALTILLLDADVTAYLSCSYEAGQRLTERVFVDGEGNLVEDPEFLEKADKYIEQSWKNFQRRVEILMETFFCTDVIGAVKGSNNFRDLLYPDYKMNRRKPGGPKNPFVPAVRQKAIDAGIAIASEGREADDLISIWAHECMKNGQDFVIASIDKDLQCIPGKHVRTRVDTTTLEVISREEAIRKYYTQIITGDPVDNIPGVPGLGKIKAEKLLRDCTTVEDYQYAVINAYFTAYGEELWSQALLLNGKLIHLQKAPDDYFNFRDWPLALELLGR